MLMVRRGRKNQKTSLRKLLTTLISLGTGKIKMHITIWPWMERRIVSNTCLANKTPSVNLTRRARRLGTHVHRCKKQWTQIKTLYTNSTTMTSLCRWILRILYLEEILAMHNSLVRLQRLDHRISAMARRWLRLVGLVMVHLSKDRTILQANRLCKVKHQADVVKKRA